MLTLISHLRFVHRYKLCMFKTKFLVINFIYIHIIILYDFRKKKKLKTEYKSKEFTNKLHFFKKENLVS